MGLYWVSEGEVYIGGLYWVSEGEVYIGGFVLGE